MNVSLIGDSQKGTRHWHSAKMGIQNCTSSTVHHRKVFFSLPFIKAVGSMLINNVLPRLPSAVTPDLLLAGFSYSQRNQLDFMIEKIITCDCNVYTVYRIFFSEWTSFTCENHVLITSKQKDSNQPTNQQGQSLTEDTTSEGTTFRWKTDLSFYDTEWVKKAVHALERTHWTDTLQLTTGFWLLCFLFQLLSLLIRERTE